MAELAARPREATDLVWKVAIGVSIAVLVAGVAAGIVVPAGLGWDFSNFYDTGRRVLAREFADLYRAGAPIGGQPAAGNMAFWGAPISAFLYVPLALLSPLSALFAFKIAGTLAYLVGLAVLAREAIASRKGWRPSYADAGVALVLLTLFQPLWTVYRVGGQSTPFVFLLFAVGLTAYRRDGRWTAAAALAAAALIKPAFILVPAILVLIGGFGLVVPLAVVFGSVGAISVLVLGWPIHAEFLRVLAAGASRSSPWFFNSSIYLLGDVLRPIADGAPVPGQGGVWPDVVRYALQGLVLISLVAMVRIRSQLRLVGEGRRRFDYLLAIGFALLFSRVVWEHYLAVMFIPIAFLIAWRDALPAGARWLLYGICVAALGQNLVFVMFLREHLEVTNTATLLLVTLGKVAPLLGFWILLLRYRRPIAELAVA